MMDLSDADRAWANRLTERLDEAGWGDIGPVEDDDEPVEKSAEQQLEEALLDSAGLDALEPPEPLIDKVLYRNSLSWLIGEPANGKSFVALDWAGHVGLGEAWCGRAVYPGTVIYVSPESPGGLRLRKQAWEAAMGRTMDNVWFLPIAVMAKNATQWQAFINIAQRREAVLIILDTQARMTVGMEENSALDMGEWVHKLEALRMATNACVLVVHHKARGQKNMRGSTALEGAAGTIINTVKDGLMLTLSADPEQGGKTKDIEQFEDIPLRMVPTGESVVLVEDGPGNINSHATAVISADPLGDDVRSTLRLWWDQRSDEYLSVSQIVREKGGDYFSKSTFYRVKNVLQEQGLLEEGGSRTRRLYALKRRP